MATRAVELLKELYGTDKRIEMEKEVAKRFDRINREYFNNELSGKYQIRFGKPMKGAYGRALAKKKIIFLSIAQFRQSGWEEIEKTLKHEMVHCWLYEKGRAWGHNREFKAKLKEIGG